MQSSRRIIPLHQIQAVWNAMAAFIPQLGEIVVYDPDEINTQPRIKIGNGKDTVKQLPFNANLQDILKYFKTGSNGVTTMPSGHISDWEQLYKSSDQSSQQLLPDQPAQPEQAE